MQFLIKLEADLEIGGDRAPVSCDFRLGAAFDDQPTACLFGRSEPVQYIEDGINRAKTADTLDSLRRKHKLF